MGNWDRRLRELLNPASTHFAGWWCHCALRRGPGSRRLERGGGSWAAPGGGVPALAHRRQAGAALPH